MSIMTLHSLERFAHTPSVPGGSQLLPARRPEHHVMKECCRVLHTVRVAWHDALDLGQQLDHVDGHFFTTSDIKSIVCFCSNATTA